MEFVPRSSLNVCREIMNVIPETEIELIRQLDKYIIDSFNKAPEVLKSGFEFKKVGFILSENIIFNNEDNDEDKKWKLKVKHIFNNTIE